MTVGFRIEKLRRDHPVDQFSCRSEALDRFLIRYALANQQANASQTYVGLHDNEVIGFYSLVVGQIAYDDAPERLTKGLARHPVPIMLLARLAVSTQWQSKGIGAGLLKDAMRRTLQAAEIGGIRAFAVHAKDAAARRFYEHFDFVPSPTDPMHLFVLIKDLRRLIELATTASNTNFDINACHEASVVPGIVARRAAGLPRSGTARGWLPARSRPARTGPGRLEADAEYWQRRAGGAHP